MLNNKLFLGMGKCAALHYVAKLSQVITVAERNHVALIAEDHRSIDKGIFAVDNSTMYRRAEIPQLRVCAIYCRTPSI